MKDWKSVPIPDKLKVLEKDKRGYPIPFSILRDSFGNPAFSGLDDCVIENCISTKSCSLCGTSLESDMWLVGEPMVALYSGGKFLEPPVHYDCGKYALQVCPYLLFSNYLNKNSLTDHPIFKEIAFRTQPTEATIQLFWVFSKIGDFTIGVVPPDIREIIPEKPFLEIEFWKNGERISTTKARELVIENNLPIHIP